MDPAKRYQLVLNAYTNLKTNNPELSITFETFEQMCNDKNFMFEHIPEKVDLIFFSMVKTNDITGIKDELEKKISLTKKMIDSDEPLFLFEREFSPETRQKRREFYNSNPDLIALPRDLGNFSYTLYTQENKFVSFYRLFRLQNNLDRGLHAPFLPNTPSDPDLDETTGAFWDEMLWGRIYMSYILFNPDLFGLSSIEFRRTRFHATQQTGTCVTRTTSARQGAESGDWLSLFNSFEPRIFTEDLYPYEKKMWSWDDDVIADGKAEVRVYEIGMLKRVFGSWDNLASICKKVDENEKKMLKGE